MSDRLRAFVALGFEVGTGTPVAMPIAHTVITGLTQHAGKTTTIEAAVSRSGLRAICFATKRGEIAFSGSRATRPYFRERADWQYVGAVLEATFRERMKFVRPWIMKACQGAKTLADVHANVQRLSGTSRGLSESVYTELDHYLQIVVPQIEGADLADRLELGVGVNLMDLTALSSEMQALVMRSVIEWVMEKEHETLVVIPEAWDFLPQGRGGPVKLEAERLLRQGAVLRNFAWLDSQDLAAIDKRYLKSVGVWILGAQPEANEAEHTLDQIPLPKSAKPKVSEVQSLQPGHFYACWGGTVRKVYVQPSWMEADVARAVAMGASLPRHTAAASVVQTRREEPEMCEKHQVLERELSELRKAREQERQFAAKEEAKLHDEVVDAKAATRAAEERTRAADALGLAIAGILPAGAGGGAAAVDEDAIVRRVLAQVPANGHGAIQVMPAEKLRNDFQQQEADRIAETARAFRPLTKKVLRLLESMNGGTIRQKAIAERLGRATAGNSLVDLAASVKELAGLGWLVVDPAHGIRKALRDKVAADLAFYQATDDDVEAVYQTVLYAIATEEA